MVAKGRIALPRFIVFETSRSAIRGKPLGGSVWGDLHSQGSLLLRQYPLLFGLNHTPLNGVLGGSRTHTIPPSRAVPYLVRRRGLKKFQNFTKNANRIAIDIEIAVKDPARLVAAVALLFHRRFLLVNLSAIFPCEKPSGLSQSLGTDFDVSHKTCVNPLTCSYAQFVIREWRMFNQRLLFIK